MKKSAVFALALAAAAPVIATPGTPTNSAAARAPVDEAHLAAGMALVDQIYPAGMTRQLMADMPSKYVDLIMDMKPKDFLTDELLKDAPKRDLDKTFRQVMSKEDPYFDERIRIIMNVITKEMGPAIDKMEPALRKGMSIGYGRNMSVEHMNELAVALKTPAGQAFAKNYYTAYLQPEVLLSYKDALPDLMKIMPKLPKKIEEATAHLPKSKLFGGMKGMGPKGGDKAADQAGDKAAAAISDDQPWLNPENWSAEDRAAVEKADADSAAAMAKSEELVSAASERAKARMKKK